jgi:hypothetical protein
MLSYLRGACHPYRVPIPLPLSTLPLRAAAEAPQIAATTSELARGRSGHRNPAGPYRVCRWKFDILRQSRRRLSAPVSTRFTVLPEGLECSLSY